MININNFVILDNGNSLAIDVETSLTYNITSIKLWNIDTFKDLTLAIDLDYKLSMINNKEVFIVTAAELKLSKFEDIYFIEVLSNEPSLTCSTCLDPALGITYNLLSYSKCMLSYILKNNITADCIESSNKNLVLNINLLIESVKLAIELGSYLQAINLVKQLKKLCGLTQCTNCQEIKCNTCGKFNQSVINPDIFILL